MSIKKDKEKILEDYITFRSLKNKTQGGLRDIKFHINKFLNHSSKPIEDFSEAMLTKYIAEVTKKYKINMANTIKASYLKNFLKWYFVDWSARFRNLDIICKTEKSEPCYNADDMLTEEEVQKMIKEEIKPFWKAYFSTLFYGGCRPSEVIQLKHKDIEYSDDGAYLKIYSNKNKKEFLKYVPSDVAFYLKKIEDNDSEYVFCNPRTKMPISVKGAFWKIKQMSKKSLNKPINLYILRHSIATINYNKDIKDDIIADSMGHSKSMKKTYMHNNKDVLKKRARSIYAIDDLPPEKKHELELKVEKLEAQLKPILEQRAKEKQEIKKMAMEYLKEIKREALNEK